MIPVVLLAALFFQVSVVVPEVGCRIVSCCVQKSICASAGERCECPRAPASTIRAVPAARPWKEPLAPVSVFSGDLGFSNPLLGPNVYAENLFCVRPTLLTPQFFGRPPPLGF